ncbi:MAG: sensor histidine kinase [Cyanobacteria bacterium J06643_13]
MNIDSVENLSPNLIKRLRYLEWLFLLVHLMLTIASGNIQFTLHFFVYLIAILFSLTLPIKCSLKYRQIYISLALSLIIFANFQDISLDLLLYLYLAKSLFLVEGKHTIYFSILAGIGWVASECIDEIEHLDLIRYEPPFGYIKYNLGTIFVFSAGIYIASSVFVIFFGSTIIAEQKSRKRAEALTDQVEILAQNLERTRIARDIHDSLGHTLTNLNIQLKVAQKLRDSDLDQAFEAIDIAAILSFQCIEDVSHAVQTMRRNNFDLNRALNNLLEQSRNDYSFQVKYEISLPSLALLSSHQIYYVVKEGLFNVQKHARASKVSFQGYSTAKQIILKLQDNGVGFDRQQISSGFGLQGIQERVQALNGELNIDSAPGKGTQILVTIPR